MLRKVYLHGALGEKFGKVFRFDVDTISEAGSALANQLEGFADEVIGKHYKIVKGKRKGGVEFGEDELGFKLGRGDLHIVPVLAGAGGRAGGIGKIVAGVFLIGAAFFFPGAIAALGASSLKVGLFGASMVFAGVGSAFAPQPKMKSSTPTENQDSYLLSGGPNVSTEGGPVPVPYGRVRVKPVIIAVGLSTEDVAI